MSQLNNTVSEDLTKILETLEQHYRTTNQNGVVLYRSGDNEKCFTAPQLARETSHLGYNGSPDQTYQVYTHNFQAGNMDVGQIVTSPQRGLIGVQIKDNTANPSTAPCRFKMSVGLGGRVIDYQVRGLDEMFRPGFRTQMVIDLLEQYLSGE